MTPALRWLLWFAILVIGSTVTLDWRDELAKLRPEIDRMKSVQRREHSAMFSIDWVEQGSLARQAQLAWLNMLPEVQQMGVFRAEAMEAMADLCKQEVARCQISALGETSLPRVRPASGSGTSEPQALVGLVSTSVRLTVDLSGGKVSSILRRIETGPVLRQVDKFSVRSGRADFIVKTFGLESDAISAVRVAVQQGVQQ